MKQIFLFIFLGFFLKGQSQSDCSEVLLLAGRNVSSQTKTTLVLKYVYDKYCSSDKISDSNSFNADVNILKKVGISLGGGTQKQQKNEMCKIYESKYQKFGSFSTYESMVVEEAIQAWKECKGLKDVEFNLTQANDIYTIQAKALTAKPVVIKGVKYKDAELIVTANLNGKTENVGSDFIYTLKDDEWFSFDIERKLMVSESDDKYYPKSGIILKTDKGNYPVIFPKEGKPEYNWVSEIDFELKQLISKVSHLQNSTLKRDDILFGVSNYYSKNNQNKTFTTTNLLTHSDKTGQNKVYWYDVNGNSKDNFADGETYNVWANIMVRGKKNFEQQNFNLTNKYLGEFVVGNEHEVLKLGTQFSSGEKIGNISIMFFAIKK